MIGAAILAAVALALGGALVVKFYRRQTPPELRGDWWSRFEGAFREYERRTAHDRRRRLEVRDQTRSHPRRRPGMARRFEGLED